MRYYNCSGDIWKISLVCITSRVWSKITKKKFLLWPFKIRPIASRQFRDKQKLDNWRLIFAYVLFSDALNRKYCIFKCIYWWRNRKKGSLLEFKREWIWTLIINLSLGKYLFSICSKCQKVMTCKWNLKVKISLKLIIFFWQIAGIIFICILNLKIYILKIVHN